MRPNHAGTLMIIDCHGHYTTEPKDLHRFRKEQTAAATAKNKAAMPPRAALKLPDDEIRESIEGNQLKEGINHFGVEVDNVAELVPRAKEWGAATDTAKRPPNREAEYRVHDPDGNPIDLSQHGWPH